MREKSDTVLGDAYLMNHSFDYAIPEWFFDAVHKIENHPLDHFVWIYDNGAAILGRPYPLTKRGEELIKFYNAENGASYPTNSHPSEVA